MNGRAFFEFKQYHIREINETASLSEHLNPLTGKKEN